MMEPTRKRRNGQPTKAELREKLTVMTLRAESAEAALLARPATATPPPGGHSQEALMTPQEGVMRVWVMTHDQGYRLRLIHLGEDGCGWEMIKYTDGTRYHLFEPIGADWIECDCPGATAHGPRCNSGKGCKHARMLKALRQLVDPGV